MQFSATTLWNSIAKGTSKFLQWKVYVKKTSTISQALTDGTWVEVTDRVEPIPSARTSIEISTGQFTADSLSVRGLGRAWWNANVFNASSSEYIEFKVELKIGLSESKLATETAYTFSGFIDKRGYVPREETDTVDFTVYTADELGNRLIGENLTTQYVNTDIDGSGTDALILPQIPGIHVTDANIASYVLKAGVHIITYEYNSGTERAKLDDGAFLTLRTTDGTDTLSNGDDTERVTIYVKPADLYTGADAKTEDIIATSAATLPKNWYTGVSARFLLKKIFEQVGITTLTFDTMALASHDSSKKVSFLDIPPQDLSVTGDRWAVVSDGTDLWIAVGHKVYLRDMANDSYTLKITLGSTDRISRLYYSDTNDHVWMFYGANATGSGKLRRYIVGTDTLSSEISLVGATAHYSTILVDWTSSTPDTYKFLYTDDTNNNLREVDGSSLTDSIVHAVAGGVPPLNGFMFGYDAGTLFQVYYQELNGGNVDYRTFDYDLTATGSDGGVALATIPTQGPGSQVYKVAAYSAVEDRIYFHDGFTGGISGDDSIKSHLRTSNATTTVFTMDGPVFCILYDGSDKTYASERTILGGKIYEIDTNAETEIYDGSYAKHSAMTMLGSTPYGVDQLGRLFRYSATLAMYVPRADFEQITVREAMIKTLQGFNLIANISPAKKALIFRRGNDSGAVQTTGNSITITASEGANPRREKGYQPKIDYVRVDNGTVAYSYDGTNFNAFVVADSRKLEVTNELIPDEIVQDVCYYMYQFWKTERDMLTIDLPLVALFQYEPCDGASISGFEEISSATGIVMGANYLRDGSMALNILSPLS